jgi:hypothetical protein
VRERVDGIAGQHHLLHRIGARDDAPPRRGRAPQLALAHHVVRTLRRVTMLHFSQHPGGAGLREQRGQVGHLEAALGAELPAEHRGILGHRLPQRVQVDRALVVALAGGQAVVEEAPAVGQPGDGFVEAGAVDAIGQQARIGHPHHTQLARFGAAAGEAERQPLLVGREGVEIDRVLAALAGHLQRVEQQALGAAHAFAQKEAALVAARLGLQVDERVADALHAAHAFAALGQRGQALAQRLARTDAPEHRL